MGFVPCGVCLAGSLCVREPGEVIPVPRTVHVGLFAQCVDAALTACECVRAIGSWENK